MQLAFPFQETERKFISELRKARFLSPAIIEVKNENGEFVTAVEGKADPKNTRVNFMMLTQKDGQKFLPAFTSIEDKAFFDHKGISIPRIIKSLLVNIKSGQIKQWFY